MFTRLLPKLAILALVLMPTAELEAAPKKADTGIGDLELILPASWDPDTAADEHRHLIRLLLGRLRNDPSLRLRVVGHTDTLGSNKENDAIGYYYARRVADELVSAFAVPADRVEVASVGEKDPVVPGGGFHEQRKNRRVVVSLLSPPLEAIAETGTPVRVTAGRNVIILEPAPGVVDRSYQIVRAVVGRSETALLTINGLSSMVAVQDSRIEAEAVLERGENTIEVMAWDESGDFGKDQVEVQYVPPPPEIEVYSPEDGELFNTTHTPVVDVRGKILATTPLAESFIFLNGSARRIEVDEQGEFSQSVVLIRRENQIRVEAIDIFNKTATSPDILVRTMNLAPRDMVVFLTWDRPAVDLDLHIWGPGNTHTYYGALDPYESTDAIPSAGLDLDDKDGYGPEVFSMAGGQAGRYLIEAKFHHTLGDRECMATLTVVLFPADPARRVTRIFGPRRMTADVLDSWLVSDIKMPEGLFENADER